MPLHRMTDHDEFEAWLRRTEDPKKTLADTLPDEILVKLDYSPEALDVLEVWLLENYQTNEQIMEPDQSTILDAIARYIGQTFQAMLDGNWDIILDNPKDVYFGLPILTNHRGRLGDICPHPLTTTSISRRQGNYLSRILRNQMKKE